jgi:hypothetical protein
MIHHQDICPTCGRPLEWKQIPEPRIGRAARLQPLPVARVPMVPALSEDPPLPPRPVYRDESEMGYLIRGVRRLVLAIIFGFGSVIGMIIVFGIVRNAFYISDGAALGVSFVVPFATIGLGAWGLSGRV